MKRYSFAFDVRDFGAIGDGETDCSEAFQKAVNAAAFQREIETDNGPWIKFTDHQAEIAKRDDLLRRALHFMSQKTLRSEFDINLYHDLMCQDLAQKDSTQ